MPDIMDGMSTARTDRSLRLDFWNRLSIPMTVSPTFAVTILLLLSGTAGADAQFFETNIRPVLAEHCFGCHGPEKNEGGLRLNTADYFQGGGNRGTILPYNDKFGLFDLVVENRSSFDHPAVSLDAETRSNLRGWIERGAPWPKPLKSAKPQTMDAFVELAKREHWAFQSVTESKVPDATDAGWARSPIDRFILAGLDRAKLQPSPMADPRSLIRRIYYDLTGLPPTYESATEFATNPSWEAYEQIVDELLASPRYGERWGRHWLDIARYSNTKGYGRGRDRYFPFPHTYRDYVIRAFNEDLPYDRFILEQLAADHLDLGDDVRPLAALGFITLGRQFPGDRNATLDDQIDVVTRGLQGLTVSCARCHDHKFDPVPTADYYSLYGVFRSSHAPSELPLIEEPDVASNSYIEYEHELEQRQDAVAAYVARVRVQLLAEARSRVSEYLHVVYDALGDDNLDDVQSLARDRTLSPQLAQRWLDHLKNNEGAPDPVFGLWWTLAQLDADNFRDEARDAIRSYLYAGPDEERLIAGPIRTHFLDANPESMDAVNEFYSVLFEEIDREWKDVLAARSQLTSDSAWPEALADPERELVRQALYGPNSPANIPPNDIERLSNAEVRQKIAARRAAVREHMGSHPGRPDRAMALVDANTPYDPYVFLRGKEATRGEDVPRRFLSVLSPGPSTPFEQGSGRIELAKAIANERNPLTARVLVNRVWMHHFGQPLVETPSDFGYQGSLPTHPALLDYLAHEFMDDGWSIKRLHKRIMLSSVYVQSSETRPEAQAIDPQNKLLWHYQRRRLNFEAMRDSLLVAADHLDITMGGLSFDISDPSYPSRRTIYAEVDRQDLPDVFATFDFAAPTSHRARRFETTVPPQSLYFMNNQFVADQARGVAAQSCGTADSNGDARIQWMYRRLFHRDPTNRELQLGIEFVNEIAKNPAINEAPVHVKSDWKYGVGVVDEATGRTTSFTEFPYWNGEDYQGDDQWPDGTFGSATLGKLGGQPGGVEHAVIRRWTSPVDSSISFIGELHHHSAIGDGIRAYIVSSREGIIWSGDVQDGLIMTEFQNHSIRMGDTVDLVVASKGEAEEDRFRWHPRLYLSGPDSTQFPKQDWLTRFDFIGPQASPPEPLDAWAQYAQVLLMSNEFIFVD